MARIEIKETSNRILKKWFAACSVFFKIMIPVSLIIKILEETGLMQYVGYALSPLMQPLGLPGEMGLVCCLNGYKSALLQGLCGLKFPVKRVHQHVRADTSA